MPFWRTPYTCEQNLTVYHVCVCVCVLWSVCYGLGCAVFDLVQEISDETLNSTDIFVFPFPFFHWLLCFLLYIYIATRTLDLSTTSFYKNLWSCSSRKCIAGKCNTYSHDQCTDISLSQHWPPLNFTSTPPTTTTWPLSWHQQDNASSSCNDHVTAIISLYCVAPEK